MDEKLALEMDVNFLVKLVVENKLDYLKAGSIEIKKSMHISQKEIDAAIAATKTTTQKMTEVDEEDLYYSAV